VRGPRRAEPESHIFAAPSFKGLREIPPRRASERDDAAKTRGRALHGTTGKLSFAAEVSSSDGDEWGRAQENAAGATGRRFQTTWRRMKRNGSGEPKSGDGKN